MLSRHVAAVVALATLALAAMAFAMPPASAAESRDANFAVFSRGEPAKMLVVGASLADEMATGLRWHLRDNPTIKISDHTKAATGLVRDDVYDWQATLEKLLTERSPDIVVVSLGGNDRQAMVVDGERHGRFSLLWRIEYFKRLERFMRTLTSRVEHVYWVSLPVVRSTEMTDHYQRLNDYVQRIGAQTGVRFIDMFDRFKGDDGFTAFGNDVNGNRTRIRDRDGIHFSMDGAKVMGKFVADAIIEDLNARRGKAALSANMRGTTTE